MKETETNEATPEQLLAVLEAQLSLKRQSRTARRSSRTGILITGMVMIMLAAAASLLVLQQLLGARDGSSQMASSIPAVEQR